jgi:AcrR family transcriptional regulator
VSTEETFVEQRLGRNRILLAARRLFASEGFNETTTLEIARAADVSHAFLLNQFRGKDQLLVEVLDAGWSPITKRIRALFRIQIPQRRLSRALELLLDSWLRDPEAAELMLLEGRRVRTGGSTVAASSGFANCVGIFDHYVAECRASGRWPDQLSNAAVRSALLALVEGLFLNGRLYTRIGFPTPATSDEARKLISVFIQGLCQPHDPVPSAECIVGGFST